MSERNATCTCLIWQDGLGNKTGRVSRDAECPEHGELARAGSKSNPLKSERVSERNAIERLRDYATLMDNKRVLEDVAAVDTLYQAAKRVAPPDEVRVPLDDYAILVLCEDYQALAAAVSRVEKP